MTVFGKVQKGGKLRLTLEIDGYHVLTGTVESDNIAPHISGIGRYLQLLDQARIVARRVMIDPPVPNVALVSEEDLETIRLLHRVIEEGKCLLPGAGTRFEGTLVPNETFFEVAETSQTEFVQVGFQPTARPFKLFGTEFSIGWLLYSLTKAKWTVDMSAVRQKKVELMQTGIEFECIGAEGSQLVITAVPERERKIQANMQ